MIGENKKKLLRNESESYPKEDRDKRGGEKWSTYNRDSSSHDMERVMSLSEMDKKFILERTSVLDLYLMVQGESLIFGSHDLLFGLALS